LKKGPSRDPSSAFAYYFVDSNIDKKSEEYLRISERARTAMAKWGDPMHPGLCTAFAAEDVWMLSQMEETYYMPAKVQCKNQYMTNNIKLEMGFSHGDLFLSLLFTALLVSAHKGYDVTFQYQTRCNGPLR
jgi:hypothetical protein